MLFEVNIFLLYWQQWHCSEDVSLGLLLVDGLVTPDKNANTNQRQESATSDNHLALDNAVGVNNSISDRSTNRIGHLKFHVAVKCSSLILGVLRKGIVYLSR